MKIAIFNPYFGKWPYWIDLYMHSCSLNKEIDFYYFTDCEIPEGYSNIPNMHFAYMSFQNYCRLVSERMGIDFHPDNPYKLCDLKPFYGKVHEDILENGGYDFWGFGDVDLVWGNIREFYTDEALAKADVFSTHADRVSGHFTLIRNTRHYMNLCFEIPSWKEKLEDQQHYGLDEMDYTVRLYGKKIQLFWKLHSALIRMSPSKEWAIYSKFMKLANAFFLPHSLCFVEHNTTPWPEDIKKHRVNFMYSGNDVYNMLTNKKVVYLHFLFLKKVWRESDYHPMQGFDRAYFTDEGVRFEKD